MKFRSELEIQKLTPPINHNHKLFLTGSCFTENIGEKLKRFKFIILENPNGILFNPVSVSEALIDCIEKKKFNEEDLFYFNEGWHSWKHHSRFSGLTADESLNKINDSIERTHEFLKEADYAMITLGSAWVYTLTDKAITGDLGRVVANNHKAPADWFIKKLMTVEEVMDSMDQMIHHLRLFNKNLHIIFTISPVRHARDGLIQNNRSKAALILAIHELIDKHDDLYYFPSYELVIDDLRDYRYYSEDLVHPNYFATQYVWEKFIDGCMDEKTKKLIGEIHSINLGFHHKAFNETSEQHKKFLENFYTKTKDLQEKFPNLDFSRELRFFGRNSES